MRCQHIVFQNLYRCNQRKLSSGTGYNFCVFGFCDEEETPCHNFGWFRVGLRLELMFSFSVVKVHQAEGKIHNPYLKCGYVTLGKLKSQAVQ